MAQHNNIALPVQRFTRADFTALRARLASKLPAETVLRLYYNEDELDARGIAGAAGLNRFLDAMRDDLIARLIDANPKLADILSHARQKNIWSKSAIDYLVNAADMALMAPRLSDPVSAWFLPIAAKRFKQDGILLMGDLMRCLRSRGAGWYRPIPCIGQGKAQRIIQWLQKYAATLGEIPTAVFHEDVVDAHSFVVISPGTTALAPLERMLLTASLNGEAGLNRHPARPLIEARHDLDLVRAFLYKHRENDKTYRAYQKELERFVLWCVKQRNKAVSSVVVEDCEAYKDFMAALPESWIGKRCTRRSADWRPFASPLSAKSRKYAVTVIRTFFRWAIDVRYLSGNPWAAVSDPKNEQAMRPIQIEKALPEALWAKVAGEGGLLDQLCAHSLAELQQRYPLRGAAATFPMDAQWRLARAAILLIGNTGIRREEATFATRDRLKPYPELPGLHELAVLGKRLKWREVFMPDRVVAALAAHWRDRGEDFDFPLSPSFLLSPVIIPETTLSLDKHATLGTGRGFSVEGLYGLIKKSLLRLANDAQFDLTEMERDALKNAGVHALRHTYGTNAVANDVPLDVVQQTLGHTSLATTTIYTQGEKKRKAGEMGRFFKGK